MRFSFIDIKKNLHCFMSRIRNVKKKRHIFADMYKTCRTTLEEYNLVVNVATISLISFVKTCKTLAIQPQI
jgi:hypothetical protein